MQHRGLFGAYQPITGRDWLKSVEPLDRKAFSEIGLLTQRERGVCLQKVGGKARARAAQRDVKGRFMPTIARFPDCTVEADLKVLVKFVYSSDERDWWIDQIVCELKPSAKFSRLEKVAHGPGWSHERLWLSDGTVPEWLEVAFIVWE